MKKLDNFDKKSFLWIVNDFDSLFGDYLCDVIV